MPPASASSERPSDGTLLARVTTNAQRNEAVRSLYGEGGSFASYFGAFPASYWQHWTVLETVELRVRTPGVGSVTVWASDAEGSSRQISTHRVEPGSELVVDLHLDSFPDGGWYWFEVEATDIAEAGWWAPSAAAPARRCRASIGITTLNREQFVLPLLQSIAANHEVLDLLDRVFLIDHGSRPVRRAEGFDAVEAALDGKLALIEQANIGGSGGFSRSMLEAMDAGSDAVVLLDDDVAIDPESLRRMIRFEEFARVPTVVGGHMFDMHRRARLLALAEGFRMDRFIWQVTGPHRQDLDGHDLRDTPWLHQRGDAQYNGWWMCLIPREVLNGAGLSLPFFIKWDDAEYGLRAAEHGFPTVTLPGAAIWHVSWDDKDDTVDWQAYYHSRNRLVAALLHSPYAHGGKAIREEFLVSLKNLFALEYGAQALRNLAYQDLLAGPAGMHAALGTRLPEIRAVLASYDSGRSIDHATAPVPTGPVPRRVDALSGAAPRGIRTLGHAVVVGLRNLTAARRAGGGAPQAELPYSRTRWWITGRFDSVLVATADGTADRWLKRDRATFRALLSEAWTSTRRIRREWPRLAAQYRATAPELVSPERWRETTSAPVGR